ncbi:sugar ABC transporter permease [Streptomyces sp. WMMC500]|uniref:carbohydrate ABC transporter permease n=1 Tax=Streptomyces sp. WMMC500 TaxID=3015154 RepID=UPI00248B5DF1|nr:sugar ABC transporter permease [Streptomyces sp. WMMC500]WBB63213.1 sugar ABC transporter permease [Streptomyces sp. WMMC500]
MTVQIPRPAAEKVKGRTRTPQPPPPGRHRKSQGTSGTLPYLLLLPALAITAVLLGYPLVKNGILSFQQLGMKELIQHLTVWNGFDNYTDVLGGEDFWRVTLRTVVFTSINVTLIMVLGTLVGLLLARLGRKMRLTLLMALVLAWAMPIIAATTVYQWLFAERYGVVNWILDKLGWHSMADYSWTSSQFSTFFVITVMLVWTSIPFVAINLYAATTTIAKELYEAAGLDGAGAWRTFTSVTLPFIKPFLIATTFLEIIWIFKAFPHVYAINGGGPDRLTETLPVYAFVEGVGNQHYGMGAAISVLTILVLMGLTSYYIRMALKQEREDS